MAKAVFQQCKAQISEPRKNNSTSKPDLKAMKEKSVDLNLESKNKIVQECEYGSCSYAI